MRKTILALPLLISLWSVPRASAFTDADYSQRANDLYNCASTLGLAKFEQVIIHKNGRPYYYIDKSGGHGAQVDVWGWVCRGQKLKRSPAKLEFAKSAELPEGFTDKCSLQKTIMQLDPLVEVITKKIDELTEKLEKGAPKDVTRIAGELARCKDIAGIHQEKAFDTLQRRQAGGARGRKNSNQP